MQEEEPVIKILRSSKRRLKPWALIRSPWRKNSTNGVQLRLGMAGSQPQRRILSTTGTVGAYPRREWSVGPKVTDGSSRKKYHKGGCRWLLFPEYHKKIVGGKDRDDRVKNDWEVKKWSLKALCKSGWEGKGYEDGRRGFFLLS